ncbi:GNAT family N-acetyltransferase [Paenibacillus sp. PR3]|uniref:GNAT family N-acetyltransferase n=1 Tax=Paenibacillus terricola TaxID=2763503 RepID=A0ABR8MZE3_9BACL|nr:GNAT family N-acetyltransferase [Paenibacillus terricola]MBD3920452.1 GNAT family N-acetyltransferase [Paenibacillus terricola]
MTNLNAPIVIDISQESMIRSIDNSLSCYPYYLARLPHAEIHEDDDLLWIDSGVPIYFFNGVFRSTIAAGHARQRIDAIIQSFRAAKQSFIWQIGPTSQPSDLPQHLLAAGFQHDESEPGMALDLYHFQAEDVQPSAGIVVRQVVSEDMLKDWVNVWAFGASDHIPLLQQMYAQLGYQDSSYRYYVSYLEGQPVATVMLFLAAGVAAVHHVVTLPEARNRGIGTAVTAHALAEAKREGYRIAILTASEDGFNIYRKLGFQVYSTIHKYVYHV